MIRRFLTSTLLALFLALTSLAAVVAETRMAVAGGYCGTGTPQILLDHMGLPLLNADGETVAAPDCPICQLALALADTCPSTTTAFTLTSLSEGPPAQRFTPFDLHLNGYARAPPQVL